MTRIYKRGGVVIIELSEKEQVMLLNMGEHISAEDTPWGAMQDKWNSFFLSLAKAIKKLKGTVWYDKHRYYEKAEF